MTTAVAQCADRLRDGGAPGGAYHLLLPARRAPSAAAALFAEWLAEEARRAG